MDRNPGSIGEFNINSGATLSADNTMSLLQIKENSGKIFRRYFADNYIRYQILDTNGSTSLTDKYQYWNQSYIRHKTADDGINIDSWTPVGNNYCGYSVLFGHYSQEFTTGTYPAEVIGGNYITVIQYDTGNESWWKVQELISQLNNAKYMRYMNSNTGSGVWSSWTRTFGVTSGTGWRRCGQVVTVNHTMNVTCGSTPTTIMTGLPSSIYGATDISIFIFAYSSVIKMGFASLILKNNSDGSAYITCEVYNNQGTVITTGTASIKINWTYIASPSSPL